MVLSSTWKSSSPSDEAGVKFISLLEGKDLSHSVFLGPGFGELGGSPRLGGFCIN